MIGVQQMPFASRAVFREDFFSLAHVQANGGAVAACTVDRGISPTGATARVDYPRTLNAGRYATRMTWRFRFKMFSANNIAAKMLLCKNPSALTDNHWGFQFNPNALLACYLASSAADTANYFYPTAGLALGATCTVHMVFNGNVSAGARGVVYVDGVRVATTIQGTLPAALRANTYPITALNLSGGSGSQPDADFVLHDARVYEGKAMSDTEVLDDYLNLTYRKVQWAPIDLNTDLHDYYDITTPTDGSLWTPSLGVDPLVQLTPASRLTRVDAQFGGVSGILPSLRGSGAGTQCISTTYVTHIPQPTTVYLVYKGVDYSTSRRVFLTPGAHIQAMNAWGNAAAGGTYLYAGSYVYSPVHIDLNPYVHCLIFNGANGRHYLDSTLIGSGAVGAEEMSGFGLGNVTGVAPNGWFGDALVCKSAHDDATRARVTEYLLARHCRCGMVVCAGDSMTEGTESTRDSYPVQLLSAKPYRVYNSGHWGATVAILAGWAATDVDPYLTQPQPWKTLVVWIGTNDLAAPPSRLPADVYADIVAYILARRAAGWRSIILNTITYRDDQAIDPQIDALNTLIRANAGSVADVICDVGAAPQLQNPSDGVYFDASKLHLTALGQAVVASLVGTAVSAISG